MGIRHKYILGLLLGLLVLIPAASGLQLGSLPKSTHAIAEPGGHAEFRLLFWTTEDTFPFKLFVKNAPENFTVTISPDTFVLNNTPDGETEAVIVPGRPAPIIARIVNVSVGIPPETSEGKYTLIVNGIAGSQEDQIAVLQERTFTFTIDVGIPSLLFHENNSEDEQDPFSEFIDTIRKGITGFFVTDEGINIFSFIGLFLILFIAWSIYRHE